MNSHCYWLLIEWMVCWAILFLLIKKQSPICSVGGELFLHCVLICGMLKNVVRLILVKTVLKFEVLWFVFGNFYLKIAFWKPTTPFFGKSFLWNVGVHSGSWNLPPEMHWVTEMKPPRCYIFMLLAILSHHMGIVSRERWNCSQYSCVSLFIMWSFPENNHNEIHGVDKFFFFFMKPCIYIRIINYTGN